MDSDIRNYDVFANIPLSALNVSCRQRLAMALNPEMLLPSHITSSGLGYTRNWTGLLELMGYPYGTVKLLRQRADPTTALLELWETEDCQATVAKLLDLLQIIDRGDVIDDVLPFVERDAQSYLNRIDHRRKQLESNNPIQDSAVSSAHTTASCPLTVHDVMINLPSEDNATKDYRYDAYVSYIDADIAFVITLIEKLEDEFHLKLFIKERDMLPGVVESEAEIKMIHERCERILLIISPEFLSDPHCEFQTMFAQALAVDNNLYARKVIPVICRPCTLPLRLKYIARVDYTKIDHFGSFWERLYSSIKDPPQGSFPMTTTSRISQNKFANSEFGPRSTVGDPPLPFSLSSTDMKGSVTKPVPLMVSALMPHNRLTQPSSLLDSGSQPIREESCIEMATLPNCHLSVKTSKSKPVKKSPTPKTKKKGFFGLGTTSNHNPD